jgi:hypothetical protein
VPDQKGNLKTKEQRILAADPGIAECGLRIEQGQFILDRKRLNHETTRNSTKPRPRILRVSLRVVSCYFVVPAFTAENELTLRIEREQKCGIRIRILTAF